MRLIDHVKFVTGIPPGILATTVGDGDYVSMKDYTNLTIVLTVDNATTVTGTAVTLKQASAVAGTGEKALSFDKMWANIDTGASDTMVETAVTSDTFTTDTTNAKNLKYQIEINESDLDLANDFTCVRIDCLAMVAALGNVEYILSGSRNNPAIANSAITD
tara:strand:+ start:7655 stop:8137 length:483 start_codon:yes stop_codon:yes gene_type:complete